MQDQTPTSRHELVAGVVKGLVDLGIKCVDEARKSFLKETVRVMAEKHPDYNVMMVHPKHTWYKGDPAHRIHEHVEFYWLGKLSFGYEIYLLRKGTEQYFRNLGDGGDINWEWTGTWCRDGKWVTFY